jgi:arylsulfatase A-like enzyme
MERNDNRLLAILQDSYKYICDGPFDGKGLAREELYNLKSDPGERLNIAELHPEQLQFFRRVRDEYFDKLNKTSMTQKPVEMSEEDDERLRALGYVQ